MRRTPHRILALLPAVALLAACGGDDDDAASADGDAAVEDVATGDEETGEDADPGGTTDEAASDDGASAAGAGSGTVTVDGVTYTFRADEICVFSPEDPEQFSMVGPGTDPDGEPVHVAAVGPNQLVVQLGSDTGMPDGPRYEYNPGYTGGDMMRLTGLEVDGSTVRAAPEMVRFEETGNEAEPVGVAQFEASC